MVTMERPTQRQIEQAEIAVKMLLYITAMDLAMLELVECLTKEGKFKQQVKHRVRQLQTQSKTSTEVAYKVFGGLDSKLCEGYVVRSWELFKDVTERIALTGVEKWYNIICSLSRLIEQYNRKLSNSFYFAYAEPLYNVAQKLPHLGYGTSNVIDLIIEKIDHKIEIEP